MYAGKSQISYRAIKGRKFSKKRWWDVGTTVPEVTREAFGRMEKGGEMKLD